jgi:oligoendopeptidase F
LDGPIDFLFGHDASAERDYNIRGAIDQRHDGVASHFSPSAEWQWYDPRHSEEECTAMKSTSSPKTIARKTPAKPAASPYPDRWNLRDLAEDPVRTIEQQLGAIDALVSTFESKRPSLSPEMEASAFAEMLRLSESITQQSSRLSAYAYLWFSENTKDLQARSFKTKVEERLTDLSNRLLFFDLWWQTVDEGNAERLMAGSGDLRYHLETIRRFKPHTLTEPEEKIINLKNITGRSAVHQLYDVVTNAFTFTLTVQGKKKQLSREELTAYVRHPRATVREAAYRELYRVYGNQQDLLAEIYKTLANDWKSENLQLRRFGSPIATRNLGNDISDKAVDVLLAVCRRNADVFQQYFRLKARICGITPMTRYHIYAPHKTEQKSYRYADAVRMVLEAYRGFSPRLADLAERVFRDKHIDAPTRPGKIGGAYCYSVVPGVTPYVLLNFTGEARDIATMAHELGHAVHGMLAEHHSVYTFHSTLPRADSLRQPDGPGIQQESPAGTSLEPAGRHLCYRPAPVVLRTLRKPGPRDDRERRHRGRPRAHVLVGSAPAVRQSGEGAGRIQMGMALDPPFVRQPVLLLRLQLRQSPCAGPLPDVQGRRQCLRAQIPRPARHWRLAIAPGNSRESRRGYDIGALLAIRLRHDPRYGPRVGTDDEIEPQPTRFCRR